MAAGAAALTSNIRVVRLTDGVYRVEHDERADVVYVAGPANDRWAFANGQVYRQKQEPSRPRRSSRGESTEALMAPMPATVLKVSVTPGAHVKAGEALVVLEAMKMEIALRAPHDGVVTGINCREGELVQPDSVLVELKST
jgi:3-methylcrotonyl-CoA carboxylase alpha subunit